MGRYDQVFDAMFGKGGDQPRKPSRRGSDGARTNGPGLGWVAPGFEWPKAIDKPSEHDLEEMQSRNLACEVMFKKAANAIMHAQLGSPDDFDGNDPESRDKLAKWSAAIVSGVIGLMADIMGSMLAAQQGASGPEEEIERLRQEFTAVVARNAARVDPDYRTREFPGE